MSVTPPPSNLAGDQALAAPRPVALTVFGILNLVFGGLGLFGAAASSIMFFIEFPADQVAANPGLALMKDESYRMILGTLLIAGALASLAGMAGGIGLLMGRGWGRGLALAYGWYSILACFVGVGVNWVYMVKPMLDAAANAGPQERAAAIGGIVGGFVGTCFGSIYPVVLIVFMLKRSVRDYLAAQQVEEPRDMERTRP